MSADETQIRSRLDEYMSARQDKDAARVLACFTTDVVSFSLAPPLREIGAVARDADALNAWFATFDGPLECEMRDLDITIGGDTAYGHSLNRLTATPRDTDVRFDLWMRSTVGLRKRDGAWLVAHEHVSTPFHMQTTDGTFRAATDLTP